MKSKISSFLISIGSTASIIFLGMQALSAPTLDPTKYESRYLRANHPEQEMNFEKLRTLIETKNIISIEQLIPLLPEEMRSDNYVVMHRSRSLQSGFPDAPRIISYTPSAEFILTFNGGPEAHRFVRGANSIEVIQFRDKAKRFEFREITFDGKNIPQFSEPDPAKCISCHQSPKRRNVDLRPNWEPYNIWPGSIGAFSGSHGTRDLPLQIDDRDREMYSDIKNEVSIAKTFVRIGKKHPRYRHLGKFSPEAPTELTEFLGKLNMDRVVRLMSEEKELLSAYQDFFTDLHFCRVDAKLAAQLAPANNPRMQKFIKAREGRSFTHSNEDFAMLITTPYENLGIDTDDWSMDFGTQGRLGFMDRFSVPTGPELHFYRSFNDRIYGGIPPAAEDCAKKNKRALVKIKSFLAKPAVQQRMQLSRKVIEPNPKEILNRCSRCHDGSDPIAPFIDFQNQLALKKQLREPTKGEHKTLLRKILFYTSGMASSEVQMPPRSPLTPEESQVLRKYLLGIVR